MSELQITIECVGGITVSATIPREPGTIAQFKRFLLDEGLVLVAGEPTDEIELLIHWVCLSRKIERDGRSVPHLDCWIEKPVVQPGGMIFPSGRFYLDDPKTIALFESASGVRLVDLPLWIDEDSKSVRQSPVWSETHKYIVRVPKPFILIKTLVGTDKKGNDKHTYRFVESPLIKSETPEPISTIYQRVLEGEFQANCIKLSQSTDCDLLTFFDLKSDPILFVQMPFFEDSFGTNFGHLPDNAQRLIMGLEPSPVGSLDGSIELPFRFTVTVSQGIVKVDAKSDLFK